MTATPEEGRGPTSRSRTGKAARPLRILVAEDENSNRELVIEFLKKRGHSAVGAVDGQEVLAAFKTQEFDIVLMDEEMPRMNGLEATRSIRQMEVSSRKRPFIIGMTGNTLEDDQKRCLDAGMDGFLAKPFDMRKLYEAVEFAGHARAETASVPASPAEPEPLFVDAVTELRRKTGGNEKLLQSLVRAYLADAPAKFSNIRRAIERKNAEDLAMAAHAMKGLLGIFGVPQAVAACRNLEAMGRAGDLDAAASECQALEQQCKLLEQELMALGPKARPRRLAARPPRKK
jgi:two-component system sensor histidine kinase/response regulator